MVKYKHTTVRLKVLEWVYHKVVLNDLIGTKLGGVELSSLSWGDPRYLRKIGWLGHDYLSYDS